MNKLSIPITKLKHAYEVVVIGSGYGGAIAASRMARAGRQVCLLEKGKEFVAGEFPVSLTQAAGEMQVHKGSKIIGDDNGLYEFVVGKDITVFKGCGLGGTSLVNANVSIEAEERVFDDEIWPATLRNNMDTLSEGISLAREMLLPTPYPEGKNGYPVLDKTSGMRASAKEMKEAFRLLDINVTFENKTNHVGVQQCKCINCGDCVTGCNHKAKNTTAMNYLPDAVNHGAEIFTEVGVSHVKKVKDHWQVYYKIYNTGREKFDAPLLFLCAKNVFICAGSLGSTEIMKRSERHGLSLSAMLGKQFTGNGDVLGFGYNNDRPINGIGLGDKIKKQATGQDCNPHINNVGPCITSVIDMRHKSALEDGMTLEEGSVPAPIRSVLMPMLTSFSRLIGKDTDAGFVDFIKEKWRELKSLVGGPYKGAINHTQVYLVMSHDSSAGEMDLNQDDHLEISWEGVGKEDIFKKVSAKLKAATKALGGNYVKNPTWTKLMNYDLVTVHPLGGCAMGENAATGVTNHKGQVFSGKTGTRLYAGLYVMDGAILPRSVGTNPLLTISGLAERNAKLIAEDQGWQIDYSFEKNPLAQTQIIKTTGVQFTETMRGYFAPKELDDYERGYDEGKKNNTSFEFTLTIRTEDVETFVNDANHLGSMIGSMSVPSLSKQPLTATNGKFNLFVEDPDNPDIHKMIYEISLLSAEGKKYFFAGFKQTKNDRGFDVWQDTTTLFITLYEGETAQGATVGKGMLKIETPDFIKQLGTMKAVHPVAKHDGMKALSTFGKFFAGTIWDTYIGGGLK